MKRFLLCVAAPLLALGAGCSVDLSRHHDRLVNGSEGQRLDAAVRLRAYYHQSPGIRLQVCRWYVDTLNDKCSDEMQVVLLRGLCDYADQGDIVVEALEDLLKQNLSPRVRMELAGTLSRFIRSDAAALLARLLAGDDDPGVRVVAAAGLGRLGLRQYAGALLRATSDASPKVRRAAAQALAALEHTQAPETPAADL